VETSPVSLPGAHLSIAGIEFVTELAQDAARLTWELSRYGPFVATCYDGPGSLRIPVRLVPVERQALPGRGLIFDSGDSWNLYADGDVRTVGCVDRQGGGVVWLARFSLGVDRVEVSCGPALRRDTPEGRVLLNPVSYPLDLVLMMYALIERQGLIVHAAGVELDGKAYLFFGRSGSGKSTLARHFETASPGCVLSDDRIVVRRIGGRLMAFGTPWLGEAALAANRGIPLGGIGRIVQAAEDRVVPVTTRECLMDVLPVISVPWFDAELSQPCLVQCERMLAESFCFRLECRNAPSVVAAVQRALTSA
jgi:hypothetical protein